jgi:hypothetical protein
MMLLVRSLEGLARISAQAAPSRAVRFAAAADALRSRLAIRAQDAEQQRLTSSMETALLVLGPSTFAAEWAAGRRQTVEQLVAEASAPL